MRSAAHLHIRRFKDGFPACLSLKQGIKPIEYVAWCVFDKVTFTVAPAGLRKFRETGQKNVHAWVRGELQESARFMWPWTNEEMLRMGYITVRYNPVEMETFEREDGTPIFAADRAILVRNKIFLPPTPS